jgi:hypothetical protein
MILQLQDIVYSYVTEIMGNGVGIFKLKVDLFSGFN